MGEVKTKARFVKIDAAALYLGVSSRWVSEATRRDPQEPGSIPFLTLPSAGRRKQIRLDLESIDRWMHRGCPPAAEMEE